MRNFTIEIPKVTSSKHALMDNDMFILPPELEASQPPEARGLGRDDVRLMVSNYLDDKVEHTRFKHFADYLETGDVVVINTSRTRKAALAAQRSNGEDIRLHVSTQLPDSQWIVELRRLDENGTQPLLHARSGETVKLPKDGSAKLLHPYQPVNQTIPADGKTRLWIAEFDLPSNLQEYLELHGEPIRYNYVPEEWDAAYYQTTYATQPGSAEMPSAGRAFTPQIITQMVARGIVIVPVILHTGVASLEAHEAPYEEYFDVPAITAETVNAARSRGNRILAVGTTVVRALETQTNDNGITHAGKGWTDLVISPRSGIRSINALLTGFHEPQASHLAMLEALTGRAHLEIAYDEAIQNKYLWHEFGDLHLILP